MHLLSVSHFSQNFTLLVQSLLASLTHIISKVIQCADRVFKRCMRGDRVLGRDFLAKPNKLINVRQLLVNLSALKEAAPIRKDCRP